jgi:PPM family protein phosphatase
MSLTLLLALVILLIFAVFGVVAFVLLRSSRLRREPPALPVVSPPAKASQPIPAPQPATARLPQPLVVPPPPPKPASPAVPKPASLPMPEIEEEITDAEITQVGMVPAEVLAAIRGKLSGDLPTPGPVEEEIDVGLEELVDETMQEETTGKQVLILVNGYARSDRGLKRNCNEDAFLILPDEPLFVVADGMGGHAAGDVAANLAVSVIEQAFKTRKFEGAGPHGWPRRGEELVATIEMANKSVMDVARSTQKYKGMGTTVVAVRFAPNKQRAYIAHVGDSRCYRLRDGDITQLTEDHSLGNLMGVKGKAARHLARAVGVRDDVAVDLTIDRPKPGDFYLICSDGLNKMMPDRDIQEWFLRTDGSMEERARSLIQESNRRGGRDNITVIAIRVDNPGPAMEAAAAERAS